LSIKDEIKQTCSKIYLIQQIKHRRRNEIAKLPKRARFEQINQTLYTFHNGTMYRKEKVCLPKQTLDMNQENLSKDFSKGQRRHMGATKISWK